MHPEFAVLSLSDKNNPKLCVCSIKITSPRPHIAECSCDATCYHLFKRKGGREDEREEDHWKQEEREDRKRWNDTYFKYVLTEWSFSLIPCLRELSYSMSTHFIFENACLSDAFNWFQDSTKGWKILFWGTRVYMWVGRKMPVIWPVPGYVSEGEGCDGYWVQGASFGVFCLFISFSCLLRGMCS